MSVINNKYKCGHRSAINAIPNAINTHTYTWHKYVFCSVVRWNAGFLQYTLKSQKILKSLKIK